MPCVHYRALFPIFQRKLGILRLHTVPKPSISGLMSAIATALQHETSPPLAPCRSACAIMDVKALPFPRGHISFWSLLRLRLSSIVTQSSNYWSQLHREGSQKSRPNHCCRVLVANVRNVAVPSIHAGLTLLSTAPI